MLFTLMYGLLLHSPCLKLEHCCIIGSSINQLSPNTAGPVEYQLYDFTVIIDYIFPRGQMNDQALGIHFDNGKVTEREGSRKRKREEGGGSRKANRRRK